MGTMLVAKSISGHLYRDSIIYAAFEIPALILLQFLTERYKTYLTFFKRKYPSTIIYTARKIKLSFQITCRNLPNNSRFLQVTDVI